MMTHKLNLVSPGPPPQAAQNIAWDVASLEIIQICRFWGRGCPLSVELMLRSTGFDDMWLRLDFFGGEFGKHTMLHPRRPTMHEYNAARCIPRCMGNIPDQ